eukprot:2159505-Prymnesium_polylepis.1
MGWTWYLGNDFVFYMISPFLVFAYRRNGAFGWACLGGLAVGSFAVSWVGVVQHKCGLYILSLIHISEPTRRS